MVTRARLMFARRAKHTDSYGEAHGAASELSRQNRITGRVKHTDHGQTNVAGSVVLYKNDLQIPYGHVFTPHFSNRVKTHRPVYGQPHFAVFQFSAKN